MRCQVSALYQACSVASPLQVLLLLPLLLLLLLLLLVRAL
jgi:hypothetical protein